MGINIVIGVIVALAVAGGAWFWHGHVTAPTQATTTASVASSDSEAAAGTTTFGQFAMRTGSWKCDIHTTAGETKSDGTAYVANGKVSADFVSQVSGRSVTSHMVSADGYAYTWSDLLPQGVKVKLDASAGTSGGQGVDAATPVQYSCAPWIEESTKFSVPASISFMEVGTKGAVQGSVDGMVKPPVPIPE